MDREREREEEAIRATRAAAGCLLAVAIPAALVLALLFIWMIATALC